MTHHDVILELPYPAPELDLLTEMMRNSIMAHVPAGEKLASLVDKQAIGPDLDDEFMPCYRLRVSFTTLPIEPKLWNGQD